MSCPQDHILNILLKCGKREPAGLARCIALSSLGIYVYQELTHETFHPKIKEAVNVLLSALRVSTQNFAKYVENVFVNITNIF